MTVERLEVEARQTASRGNLEKINADGCRGCGQVYVSILNSFRLSVSPGWNDMAALPQGPDGGVDRVVRVRGRQWGGILGKRVCLNCKDPK